MDRVDHDALVVGLAEVEFPLEPVSALAAQRLDVGEGLVPLPAEGITVGAILLRPRSRGTIRLASADPAEIERLARATQVEVL